VLRQLVQHVKCRPASHAIKDLATRWITTHPLNQLAIELNRGEAAHCCSRPARWCCSPRQRRALLVTTQCQDPADASRRITDVSPVPVTPLRSGYRARHSAGLAVPSRIAPAAAPRTVRIRPRQLSLKLLIEQSI
jgi:hypothetical protein